MRLRFPFQRELPFEFVYELFSLLAAIILVHAVYVTLVRPLAAAEHRAALVAGQGDVGGDLVQVLPRDQRALFGGAVERIAHAQSTGRLDEGRGESVED